MYRQDYILRLIEQFARALSGLLNKILRREVPAHEIRAEIGAIATQAGLDLNVARALDPVMLLMWLAPRGDIDPGRFWLMAELLFLEGLQQRQEGAPDRGDADLERALVILLKLDSAWRPQPDLSSAEERIAEIRALLEDGGSPRA